MYCFSPFLMRKKRCTTAPSKHSDQDGAPRSGRKEDAGSRATPGRISQRIPFSNTEPLGAVIACSAPPVAPPLRL